MQGVALLRHLCHVGATLGADALRFGAAWVRSRTALAAENLFLRKQLALYREREVTPPARHRCDPTGAGPAGPGLSLARRAPHRAARHADPLAPAGLSPVLAVAIPRPGAAPDPRGPAPV